MANEDTRKIQRILETIQSNPESNLEELASKVGFPEREMKIILQELKRQNIINNEHENIRILEEGKDVDTIVKDLKIYEPYSRSIVVDELVHQIGLFYQEADKLIPNIRSEFSKYSYEELIDRYLDRTNKWIEELGRKHTSSAEQDRVDLIKDRDFMEKGIKSIILTSGNVDLEPDEDFNICSIASFNDIRPFNLGRQLFPITVSLGIAQKTAVIKKKDEVPTPLYDPETPGTVAMEHIKDIDSYPAYLNYGDKIRIRYSENKIYLYDFAGKNMREYSPTVLLLGESVLPPDMHYLDFGEPFRRKRHLECMNKAVYIANSSKLFDCPVAHVTRSNALRRRETSILTRLAFGLVAESPQDYIKLTMRRNLDDVVFSLISKDKEISPCFVIDEKFVYLKDVDRGNTTEEGKALSIFMRDGEDVEGKKVYNAYKNMLDGLQTTIIFLNYDGAGLRFRFLSYAVNDNEIKEWAVRLANYGYLDAVKKEGGVAHISSVEDAIAHSKKRADETFGIIFRTLEYQLGG